MAGSVADIVIKAIADATGVTNGMNQAQRALSKFSSQAKASSRGVGGAFTSVAGSITTVATTLAGMSASISAAGFAVGLRSAIERLDDLGDKAQAIGDTAQNLSELDYIAKRMGVNIEGGVGPAIDKMMKNLGEASIKGGDASKVIEALGIDMQGLISLQPSEAFIAISEAISQIENPFERAGAAASIFGKSAKDLMAMFQDPSQIVEYANDFEKLHPSINDAATKAGLAADQFDRMNEALHGVGENMVLAFGPKVTQILKATADAIGNINQEIQNTGKQTKGESPFSAFEKSIRDQLFGENGKPPFYDAFRDIFKASADAKVVQPNMDVIRAIKRGEPVGNEIPQSSQDAIDAHTGGAAQESQYLTTGAIGQFIDAFTQQKEDEKKLAEDAKRLVEEAMSPIEKYNAKVDELDKQLDAHNITQETWARLEKKYWDDATKSLENHEKKLNSIQKKQEQVTALNKYSQQMAWLDNIVDYNTPDGGFIGGVPLNHHYFSDPVTSAQMGGRQIWSQDDITQFANDAYSELQQSMGDPQMDENNRLLGVIADNTDDYGMYA
mgnify:CR=1 FL=1|jgi:hypothetical protein